ncbi:MAG: hypothetical protein QOH35_2067 [Acidobacteriaceae bacterium]|jgi:hypothetical protein|nr:hypothetical protein [Acidobacteriaceae bacterium]MEA2540701.1 hypothetical protein [Acidobacteriaceae bacterium]MEA3007929.1 hypothetical protein [Acidobacteriaceae bacterium]
MRISRNSHSTFPRWRRLVIVRDVSGKRDPCIALDRAQIPHVVGLHYRYETPTGKPREAEPWIMVPLQNYSAACSLLFSPPNTRE